jgi:hypothetical protein
VRYSIDGDPRAAATTTGATSGKKKIFFPSVVTDDPADRVDRTRALSVSRHHAGEDEEKKKS